ncbi:S24 family peptidase [Thalassotalea sp. 1_MG-2023]|uniref:S24 family peptidase n=1 Tax=Thalassotalea sp. 1_MG-2023 TaxID=3062680 RepID=UPI0026E40A11|nr:S24 family peptidase [Thalassotalea sp. 1_MG-2023]MDO6427875.1 S24 family peptidase [Thalassotalea sp. 1_MG-2023]
MLGLKFWKVKGHSMAPLFPQNSAVLVCNWLNFLPIKEGHRVLIKHRRFGIVVKTVAVIDRNGFIWGKGENETSETIEELGPMNKEQIIGRIIYVNKVAM